MSSGTSIDDKCVEVYQELKLGKKYRYAFFGLSADLKQVILVSTGTESDYKSFADQFPKDECRYAVYDFNYTKADGEERNRILFFLWTPEGAKIQRRMIATSAKDALRKKFVGIGTEIQATEAAEVSYDAVLARVRAA
ncbi:actin depolymerization factor/cofilin-like domain-containing protein [Kitasatospora sp. NPDC094016]|uniref:actin-binding ADF family protein n=1 Tax=Kitasatospora sp. NPDC094016 TaxID=3154986 RepID=UPI00331AFDDE